MAIAPTTKPTAPNPAPAEKTAEDTQTTEAVVESAEKVFIFATKNIPNYRLGPWQFVQGQLKLTDAAEAAKLRACLESLPPIDRMTVFEIDLAAAEALVKNQKPVAQQGGTDSAELRAAMDAAKAAGNNGL